MTPTHTGAAPQLHDDDPIDEPRTGTVAYFSDGRQWGAPIGEPAAAHDLHLTTEDLIAALDRERNEHRVTVLRVAELETRIETATAGLQRANRDLLAALERERDAEHRSELAEARLELIQAPEVWTIACSICGATRGSACAAWPSHARETSDDEDGDTQVVDVDDIEPRPAPTRCGSSLRHLALLAQELVRCERAMHEHERKGRGVMPARLLAEHDAVLIAIAAAGLCLNKPRCLKTLDAASKPS